LAGEITSGLFPYGGIQRLLSTQGSLAKVDNRCIMKCVSKLWSSLWTVRTWSR